MLPGTIFMLIFIIVVILGGSFFLVARNLKNERNHIPQEETQETEAET